MPNYEGEWQSQNYKIRIPDYGEGVPGMGGGGGLGVEKYGWRITPTQIDHYDGWVGNFLITENGNLVGMDMEGNRYGEVRADYGGIISHCSYALVEGAIGVFIECGATDFYIYSDASSYPLFQTGSLVSGEKSFLPGIHNSRHLGASDYRFKTGWFVNIYSSNGFTTGDLIFKNNWKITEIENGLAIVNDKDEVLFELTEEGIFDKTKNKRRKIVKKSEKVAPEQEEEVNKYRVAENFKPRSKKYLGISRKK